MLLRKIDISRLGRPSENRTPGAILANMLLAAVSLFVNGFGVYLTIQANIGAAPWDILNIGISRSLHILYGSASIAVSVTILIIDILLKEPIGLAMFIDAVVVGKAVDFFNWLHPVSPCQSLLTAIPVMMAGLFVLAYTQYTYMMASLGCGPRDTLMVGLAKRLKNIPLRWSALRCSVRRPSSAGCWAGLSGSGRSSVLSVQGRSCSSPFVPFASMRRGSGISG